MMETSKMVRKTGRAPSSGQTGTSTLVHGREANSMASEYGLTPRMGRRDRASGLKARDTDGSLALKCSHNLHLAGLAGFDLYLCRKPQFYSIIMMSLFHMLNFIHPVQVI